MLPRERADVFDKLKRSCLVRLQRKAESRPVWRFSFHHLQQRIEYIKRKLQTIHFFGVNR